MSRSDASRLLVSILRFESCPHFTYCSRGLATKTDQKRESDLMFISPQQPEQPMSFNLRRAPVAISRVLRWERFLTGQLGNFTFRRNHPDREQYLPRVCRTLACEF